MNRAMHAATDRLEFAPPATPGLLRALTLAVLAHCLLVLALTWGVHWKRDAQILSAEAELWSAVPQEAAPKLVEPPPEPPAPLTPEPTAPEPPAPKAPEVDIALQQEKLRLKKQHQLELAKQEELKLEKLKLEKQKQDKLKQEQADKAKKEALDKKATELDAKQLEAQREKNLQRMTGMAGATGAANSTGTALKSSGPSASYAGRIRARIKPNIVFTEEIQSNPTTEVEVHTAPDGTIIASKITKSSGLKSWDEAVLKAIDKTAVLPRDLDGSVPSSFVLIFRPRD